MAGKTLGHIDCPTCGTPKGMRITHDKNGHPFGYCEAACSQQMRVGGDASRVKRFIQRYPWAAGEVVENTPAPKLPAPVTGTAPAPAPAKRPAPAPPPAPEPDQPPEPVTPMSSMASALKAFGITK